MEGAYRIRLAALGLFLLAVAAIGTWMVRRNEAAEAASWGLSFPQPGECPVGNAGQAELAEKGAVFVGEIGRAHV